SGLTSQFGLQLADQFSNELASQQRGIQIIDRSNLREYLEKERISSDLVSNDSAIRWLGKALNATTVLTGVTKHLGSFVHVQLKRSEEHTSELQSRGHLVCRLLLEKKKKKKTIKITKI